ncbi:MAG: hypothetical protein PUG48_06825 [Clostridia bacterium]|nr:hypothetical protein [Clostridia bacterium]
MAILSTIAGIFGCNKAQKYTADDIQEFSISCNHMDFSFAYSFDIKKSEDGWLFSAECFTDGKSQHTEFENCPVTNEEVEELLAIIREKDIIDGIKNYKKPVVEFQVLDETTYYSSIRFSDGESISAGTIISGNETESYFYSLAEKYSNVNTVNEN